MTPDDLDRILAAEEPLIPSSGFAASVMERVHEAVSAPPPLPFPWRRFLLGLVSASALAGLCGWLVGQTVAGELRAGLAGLSAALAESRMSVALGEAFAALGGTYVLVRLTMLVTGGRR